MEQVSRMTLQGMMHKLRAIVQYLPQQQPEDASPNIVFAMHRIKT
jgi:ribosomal protein S15P/S13E